MKNPPLLSRPRRQSLGLPFLLACLLAASPLPAPGLTPQVSKLHPPGTVTDDIDDFGAEVAVNEKWVVVGEPARDGDTGAVHVYHASTSRLARTLLAGDRDTGHLFGTSVALCGDTVIVGAPGDEGDRGAAYLFDLRNGRQLAKLVPTTVDADDLFGTDVALSGSLCLIGAPGENVTPAVEGAAYLYDATTFQMIRRYRPTDETGGDRFGQSVALCGEILLVGADQNAEAASTAGAVYVYSSLASTVIRKLLPPGGGAAVGSLFGCSVATDGKHALVGASDSPRFIANGGAAFLFDLATGNLLYELDPGDLVGAEDYGLKVALSGNLALIGRSRDRELGSSAGSACLFTLSSGEFHQKILAPDTSTSHAFGYGVSLCGNLMAIGALRDSDVKANAGAVYFYRQLAGPSPLTSRAKVRDFAPGTPGADFRLFTQMGINGEGDTAISASLTGPGSGGNRDKGLWSDMDSLGGANRLWVRARQPLESISGAFLAGWEGITAQSAELLAFQRPVNGITRVKLAGPGVTPANRELIMSRYTPVVRTGDVIGPFTQPIQQFFEVSQSGGTNQYLTVVVQAKRGGNINATNDTGILRIDNFGGFVQSYTEGFFDQGQFFGRCAASSDDFMTWGGFYFPGGNGPVQGAMTRSISGTPPDVFIHGGMAINGLSGVFPRAVLGETELDSYSYARATLRGQGINAGNNEGVFFTRVDSLILRKGEAPIPQRPEQVIARILQFWPTTEFDLGKGIALVKLRGPGVNGSNDCALVRVRGLGFYEMLLREGDEVCDWDCPRVGGIQRVDVDPATGRYAVVASLTGSPRRNQGLFTGHASATDSLFRKASLRLRKGIAYQAPGGDTTTLRSILLAPFPTRSGVGATGKTQVINGNGEVVVCLQFDNQAKEIMRGLP